ncbi:MAG: hypothetical protein WCS37_17245 [Chloroflexota bacterium]|nr:hypothetical protein [Chloroflexota bacterium]
MQPWDYFVMKFKLVVTDDFQGFVLDTNPYSEEWVEQQFGKSPVFELVAKSMGKDAWELVSFTQMTPNLFQVVFKRPKIY